MLLCSPRYPRVRRRPSCLVAERARAEEGKHGARMEEAARARGESTGRRVLGAQVEAFFKAFDKA